MSRWICGFCIALCMGTAGAFGAELPYTQHEDVIYGDSHGIGLMMDIFVPTGDKNGLAIVDVASGSWFSDRGKINDHKKASMYDIFCGKGYTVFAVRPGSQTRFTADDMLTHVRLGIRWVKAHAEEYGIDPERVGIMGASAGGHLASLATVTPLSGNPKSKDPLGRLSTEVAAAGIFFPPTDFLNWGDEGTPDFDRIGAIFFSGGINGHSKEDVEAKARELSPALRINGKTPPFIIWHGDADPLVPLQQSEEFVSKLKKAGTDVTFKVKPGGGHPGLTIAEEVEDMANWFDSKLGVAAE